jgi:hypothetical protein
MRGRWMEAASRRVFSAESFSLLVEPAIADLQLETSGRFSDRVDAYRTVWIGMAAACDAGVARRGRAFVREHDLLTLAGLTLLHMAHSTWMVVLLLGLDNRAHLGRMLWQMLPALQSPAFLSIASVLGLYGARAFIRRLRARPLTTSVVRVLE